MAKIAVDIDSTLYDFETPAREAFTKLSAERGERSILRGAYDPWTEWRSPADACGIEIWLEAIALCHANDVILAQTPYNGAVETCQALANEGHELLYISNRAVETADATHEWLQEWNFPVDENITEAVEWHGGHCLKVLTTDKKPFLKDCQYLIDDRPKTVVDFIYDYDWETRIRREADRIHGNGPDVGDPAWEDYEKILSVCIDDRYRLDALYAENGPEESIDSVREVLAEDLERLHESAEKAAQEYISANRRRAFVIAYSYNQALTDVPHLYLAPTWAGLNEYLVGKGVLSQPAYHPLGVAA